MAELVEIERATSPLSEVSEAALMRGPRRASLRGGVLAERPLLRLDEIHH